MKKTITLTETLTNKSGNPFVSICRGHVTATDYNRAFKAEGWDGDWIHKENITHEYWRKNKDGSWKKSTKDDPKAVKVTVSYW